MTRCRRFLLLVLAAGVGGPGGGAPALAVESFPAPRPVTRAQAVTSLTAGGRLPVPCLSPMVQSLLEEPGDGNVALARALGFLQMAKNVPAERRVVGQDGTPIRYALQRGSVATPG